MSSTIDTINIEKFPKNCHNIHNFGKIDFDKRRKKNAKRP